MLSVKQCTVCRQAKAEHTKLQGLMQLLQVPKQAWSWISMDFIKGMPRSTIMIVF